MSMSGPSCPKCGAASQNPSATACVYCGTAMPPPQQAQGYGAPGGYGAPPAPYGAPSPYGAPPQQGYGGPQQGYGGPQQGYGGPQPQQGYGGPQPPVFHSGPPVQTFGQPHYHQGNGFMSAVSGFGNAMFWIRLVIAVVVLSVFGLASCINALSH